MKKEKLNKLTRLLLLICSLSLVGVLFVPLWRIDLVAPQYPEGLVLLIHADKLGGNVDIINGLNHYIGMRTLHADDFVEFSILPYIIIFFSVFFLAVSITANAKLMKVLFFLYVAFGILAMYDFWRWEYDYGHNLNPDAAIIVPGMAYQPPLIGFKQLLNFGAYSFPDVGGWIFIVVGVILLGSIIYYWRSGINKIKISNALPLILFVVLLSSCSVQPKPIKTGSDFCNFCKMTITEAKYAAQYINKNGKAYVFDDIKCLINYYKMIDEKDKLGAKIYFTDYNNPSAFISAKDVVILKSDALRTPMDGRMIAFATQQALDQFKTSSSDEVLTWQTAIAP